jgi:hypothetical protein
VIGEVVDYAEVHTAPIISFDQLPELFKKVPVPSK